MAGLVLTGSFQALGPLRSSTRHISRAIIGPFMTQGGHQVSQNRAEPHWYWHRSLRARNANQITLAAAMSAALENGRNIRRYCPGVRPVERLNSLRKKARLS